MRLSHRYGPVRPVNDGTKDDQKKDDSGGAVDGHTNQSIPVRDDQHPVTQFIAVGIGVNHPGGGEE